MALDTLKQTRLVQMEQITRERQKYQDMTRADPSTFKIRRMQETLKQVIRKKDELDNIHAAISAFPDEINEEDEAATQQEFLDNAEATQDLIGELIEVQKIHSGIEDLRGDIASLTKQQAEQPDKHHNIILNRITRSLERVRTTLHEAALSIDNTYIEDIEGLQDLFLTKAATTPSTLKLETSSTSEEPETPRRRKMALLKLAVPKFNGGILKWDAFWTRFQSNIALDPFYTDVDKLSYLQEAIEDPAVDSSLFNGVKNEHHYTEVVRRLHERYDKPKKIHAVYCTRLQQTSLVKHTKLDMQTFLDQAQHTFSGLEATGQCTSDAIITTMLLQRLPRVDKEAWMQLTLTEDTIRPPQELFKFLRGRIDTIDAGLTDPESLNKGADESKPESKRDRRRDKTPTKQQHRASIHVASQQPYKGTANSVLLRSTLSTSVRSSRPWM